MENKTFFLILILYVTATKFKNLFSNLKYFLFLFLFTVVVIYNQNTILKHVPMLGEGYFDYKYCRRRKLRKGGHQTG